MCDTKMENIINTRKECEKSVNIIILETNMEKQKFSKLQTPIGMLRDVHRQVMTDQTMIKQELK